MANIVLNESRDSFKKQGWDSSPWKKRKKRERNKRNRAILVDSGTLRKSGRVFEAHWKRIRVAYPGNVVPYGGYHNYGTNKLPKRQFIGDSRRQRKNIIKLLYKEMDFIMR